MIFNFDIMDPTNIIRSEIISCERWFQKRDRNNKEKTEQEEMKEESHQLELKKQYDANEDARINGLVIT